MSQLHLFPTLVLTAFFSGDGVDVHFRVHRALHRGSGEGGHLVKWAAVLKSDQLSSRSFLFQEGNVFPSLRVLWL